jgi:hypothetical protein|uniref:Uncharacterized protein n=1 Tax=viral metagenome TaxID=1070528 RepID=A0A6C0IMV0_9ZZZZ
MSNSLVLSEKEEFIKNIQKWNYIDSQLKEVNEKTKKMRTLKNELGSHICSYWENNPSLKHKIGIGKNEIQMYSKKEYTTLSFTYIESKLKEIIQDENQVDFVIQYLKDKREITTTNELRKIVT